jgi:NhaP-type Na+/H+ and K+/H+ antiporter
MRWNWYKALVGLLAGAAVVVAVLPLMGVLIDQRVGWGVIALLVLLSVVVFCAGLVEKRKPLEGIEVKGSANRVTGNLNLPSTQISGDRNEIASNIFNDRRGTGD